MGCIERVEDLKFTWERKNSEFSSLYESLLMKINLRLVRRIQLSYSKIKKWETGR